jgi:hypothetical protein
VTDSSDAEKRFFAPPLVGLFFWPPETKSVAGFTNYFSLPSAGRHIQGIILTGDGSGSNQPGLKARAKACAKPVEDGRHSLQI